MKGPHFLKYCIPLLRVMKNLGGSGATGEVVDAVIADLNIPDSEVEQLIPSGQSRVRNQIQWARFYLTKAGLMDSPKSGVWRLTQEGVDAKLTEEQVYQLFQRIHQTVGGDPKSRAEKKAKKEKENLDNDIVEDEAHSESLLETLKALCRRKASSGSANACSQRSASTTSRSPAALATKASMASAASA